MCDVDGRMTMSPLYQVLHRALIEHTGYVSIRQRMSHMCDVDGRMTMPPLYQVLHRALIEHTAYVSVCLRCATLMGA
jgi:hypothetical protein